MFDGSTMQSVDFGKFLIQTLLVQGISGYCQLKIQLIPGIVIDKCFNFLQMSTN